MAIGRISGPLLKANLIRDGVDLAFETDLLYLDVTNSRIGVNTPSPTADLDVNGTIKTTNISISDSLIVGDITFSGNSITSSSTISFLSAADQATIYHSKLQIDDLQISGNTIATNVSNSNIELVPNGTGIVDIQSDATINGDLDVTGNITATGNITIGGNIILGDEVTDTVTINARISSDVIPDATNTYDIGSPTARWANGYFNNFSVSSTLTLGAFTFSGNTITSSSSSIFFQTPPGNSVVFDSKLVVGDFEIDNNVISTTVSNSSIDIRPNGTGTIELEATTNVTGDLNVTGNITSTGDVTVNGNTILGDNNSDTVTINSELIGDLIPTVDNTYDIGSSSRRWNTAYYDNFVVSSSLTLDSFTFTDNTITSSDNSIFFETVPGGSVVFDSKLVVGDFKIDNNVISTTVSNSSIDIRPNGTGTIELEATTNVTGDLNITGNISAQGNITIGGNVIIGDSLADTVTFNASIQSDLIPETTNTYDLGSSSFYWKAVYTDSLYTNSLNVPSLSVGDIIFTDNEISTTAGEDLLLDGNGSGGVQISNFLFSGNTITNVVPDAISVIAQTGIGYFKIDTTNGFVMPLGTIAERPSAYAVVGMTRYNTQLKALEIWDGATWASPAGAGGAITEATANDISAAYALILG